MTQIQNFKQLIRLPICQTASSLAGHGLRSDVMQLW
jgi:hypothetical protein